MGNPGSGSGPGKGPERKGSVQRARQMLEAGRRPKVQEPEPSKDRRDVRSISSKASHMTQWPLPDNSTMPVNFLDPQARLIPRGPPPRRPPRPDAPSPSIYSERSTAGFTPRPLHIRQPRQSFSQPLPYQTPSQIPARDTPSPSGRSTPRISVFNEDFSDTASVSSTPNFPFPAQQGKTAGLVPPPPNSNRHTFGRRSSVSPIPEELTNSPTNVDVSYASSRAVPSGCNSPARDSEFLGTYLDDEPDDCQEAKKPAGDGDGLVRSASIGTRGKPSLRMIRKPSAESPVPPADQPRVIEANAIGRALSGTPADESRAPVPSPKDSYASLSDRSYEFDLEKGAFVLDIGQPHPAFQHDPENQPGLPRVAPTMSDKRPGARRPPRLNMDAVRDAQARGSLTSLPDLIRRATRLASDLDHGRTASKSDDLSSSNDSRGLPWNRQRSSGSLQDALESFPTPPRNTQGYSSWPMFLRRSTLNNLETLNSHSDHGEAEEKQQKRSRRCCGMPLWLFILICVVVIIVIALAVLIPVFLVAVPKEKANNDLSTCEKSHPCKNGGVSVSSGSVCSCVCTNGYTGSQCTIAGDSSCTTTDIDGGSTAKTATMGSELPQLFQDSQETFDIHLDPVTIMALFSKSNSSCTAQNELVSFDDVSVSSKARRFFPISLDDPSQTLAARDTVATMNGIIFDDSSPTAESLPTATDITTASAATPPPQETSTTSSETSTTTSAPTTTAPTTSSTSASTPTSTKTSTSTPSSVLQKALTFSQIATLYIFEMTGALNAAIHSEEDIQHYLRTTYAASGGGNYDVDLSESGVQANFALDFDAWTITMGNGTSVGGT